MTGRKVDPWVPSSPIFEGDRARELGAERTDNPYAEGTDEFSQWDYGWQMIDEAAQHREDD